FSLMGQSKFTTTFGYEFKDQNAPQLFLPPVSFPYAAAHASEIQYIFGLRANVPAPAFTPEQEALSATMIDYWSTFARRGQPNSPGQPVWPVSMGDNFQPLDTPAVTTEMTFAADHKCAFWDPLLHPAPKM